MIQQPEPNASHHGRARAAAASQRFASAALVHPQANLAARDDLHKARIDAARKARVALDQRAEYFDRRRVYVIDQLHRMRIAHRQYSYQYRSCLRR